MYKRVVFPLLFLLSFSHTSAMKKLLKNSLKTVSRKRWVKVDSLSILEELQASGKIRFKEIDERELKEFRREATNFFLNENIDDVNGVTSLGNTALHFVSFSGNIKLASDLLSDGAESDAKNDDGDTPLHLAAYRGYSGLLTLLLMSGADPNAQNKNGDTPLHIAARCGHSKTANQLCIGKADISIENNQGKTPLKVVVPEDEEMVEMLKKFEKEEN